VASLTRFTVPAVFAVCLAAGGPAFQSASAADYPTKPIRVVVTVAPGGAADTTARVVGQSLSSALGQHVVVDNRPGAGGNIGAELVAKSPPDGYTLLLGGPQHAIAVSLYAKLNYDLLKDFAPISLLASSPLLVTVHPSVAATSVRELVNLAQARPHQLNYSSAGIGSGLHLAGVLFSEMAGVKMNHVPFKGGVLGLIAVVGGEVQVGFSAITAAIPHVKVGKLRALGVSSAGRSPVVPEIPTIAEAGLPGYEAVLWWGLNAPRGTPQQVISRLHAESAKSLRLIEVRERLAATDIESIGSSPQQFDAYIRSEVAKWGKVVKASGLQPY
jgi:tripartite-type tricarboxylate transporter receptor subunit TctC